MIAGCGASAPQHRHFAAPAPAPPHSDRRGSALAIGLSEGNASLIAPANGPLTPWRAQLLALNPDYLRVAVDWAKLQPSATAPPALAAPQDGCDRGIPPCAAYAGLRDLFAAIAAQQHAGARMRPVVVIYGVPAWAAQPPSGCERPGTAARSRELRADAVPAYRGLIRSLLALGRSVGLELPWWSPWNEPNHPYFSSPQRASCDARAVALAPSRYAALARAMSAELLADGPHHALVLGDLAGYPKPSPLTASVAEFVAALPDDVVCSGAVWAAHDYALQDAASGADTPVRQLERALDARGPCGARARVWVSETGAPAPDARSAGASAAATQCRRLAAALAHWNGDPRIDAVFQYTFREDPAFRDGLADARLTRLYPAFAVWLRWGRRAAADPAPDGARAC